MSRPALVIFDCDGVLVDSEHIDARIRSECFRACGFEVTTEDLLANPGTSRAGLAEMIERRFGQPIPEGFMEATRAKILSAFTRELKSIDGVSQLLGSLPMPICVASNSHPDRIRHSLEVTDLWRFFDPHVFSATMVTRPKPAPDLFLYAAERFNIHPRDCLVVEDSINGITAARAAGMELSDSAVVAIASPVMPVVCGRRVAIMCSLRWTRFTSFCIRCTKSDDEECLGGNLDSTSG